MASSAPARDLRSLFDPSSVAVVGASADESKWGNWLAKGALRGEHRRRVALVNRRGGSVLGRPAYGSVSQVPGGAELAVLCVPAGEFERAVNEAIANGAKAIVGISAGLGETGCDGRRAEAAAVARVREAGAVLLGPNCLGILNVAGELYLTSNELPSGTVGLISQSGNLALELGIKAGQAGIGFSRFASLGNQADLDVADLVADFTLAPDVAAIAVYCEDFRRGRRFLEAASEAAQAGKPVVLLTVGTSQAASRAARSHTGALVSEAMAIDAACGAAGVERVATPQELVDVLAGLTAGMGPAGRRIGVLGDGGGHGAVAADVAEAAGLVVPAFSPALERSLAALTGAPGGTSNPVDLAGAGERDVWSFAKVLEAMLGSGEVDSVLLTGYFGGYGFYGEALARSELAVADALIGLAEGAGKPVVVHSMHEDVTAREPLRRLQAGRLPVFSRVEAAASVLARLAARASVIREGLPGLPPVMTACPRPAEDGYFAARRLLEDGGLVFASARQVADLAEALSAAAEIGYPVALKAPALQHKSDVGGVVLGLDSDSSLEIAAREMWARHGPEPLSVESMMDLGRGVELLVGARRDARFGAIVLVGIGGVYTEIMGDVGAALAPVTEHQAGRLVADLRGAPLLLGARGRRPLDVAAAARAIRALSEVAASHPDVAEIEVNPLLVCEEGAYGLDARMALVPGGQAEPGS